MGVHRWNSTHSLSADGWARRVIVVESGRKGLKRRDLCHRRLETAVTSTTTLSGMSGTKGDDAAAAKAEDDDD